jgi:integrase
MRRGELLALRWRDIDLARSTIAIRRSAGPIQRKGQGARAQEADTKNKRPRVVSHRYQSTASPPSRSAWTSAT